MTVSNDEPEGTGQQGTKNVLTLKCTPEEHQMVAAIARKTLRSKTAVVRLAVRKFCESHELMGM